MLSKFKVLGNISGSVLVFIVPEEVYMPAAPASVSRDSVDV